MKQRKKQGNPVKAHFQKQCFSFPRIKEDFPDKCKLEGWKYKTQTQNFVSRRKYPNTLIEKT